MEGHACRMSDTGRSIHSFPCLPHHSNTFTMSYRPSTNPTQVVAEALSGSVRLEAMPKAVVEVYVLVLQAHGGELGMY